jgi:hypothetical protein
MRAQIIEDGDHTIGLAPHDQVPAQKGGANGLARVDVNGSSDRMPEAGRQRYEGRIGVSHPNPP